MRSLPLPARLYVGATIAVGALLVVSLGPRSTFSNLPLFALLLILSAVTSAFKVSLPLAKSGSTMSVSYAVDFASLLLLVPHEDQESDLPDLVQHGVPRDHGAGIWLCVRVARRRPWYAGARYCGCRT